MTLKFSSKFSGDPLTINYIRYHNDSQSIDGRTVGKELAYFEINPEAIEVINPCRIQIKWPLLGKVLYAGTIKHFEMTDIHGCVLITGSVGTSSNDDIVIDSTALAYHQDIILNSCSINLPEAEWIGVSIALGSIIPTCILANSQIDAIVDMINTQTTFRSRFEMFKLFGLV